MSDVATATATRFSLSELIAPVRAYQHILIFTGNDMLNSCRLVSDYNLIFADYETGISALHNLRPSAIYFELDQVDPTSLHFNYVCSIAEKKGIPLILHSFDFERDAQKLALSFGFDDYYCGQFDDDCIKKIQFVQKLKKYKKEASGSRRSLPFAPEVKLWKFKRAFDILISSVLLLILSPLLVIIAIIIKLESSGPVLYVSKRAGNGYKIFDFYKFRSMADGADHQLKELKNQYGDSLFYKIENDPRVTRFGSFLRNTSLDELPQLFNVLKGDMSLVGNRPLPLYEAEKLTNDNIAWRFLAPAGITGLWQVTKRGKDQMSASERIELDMVYAQNNSFLYDLKILFSTFPALIQKEKV